MISNQTAPRWPATVPLATGMFALVLLIGGLGVWSVKATLAGAVMASGMVQVENNRQVIQHPDGGVVGEILVKDSDVVEKGDVLIRLDGRRLQSELSIIDGQLYEIDARKARLVAERDDTETVAFPDYLVELSETNAEIQQLLRGESSLFQARREALGQEYSLLEERNTQIENRSNGINAQLEAMRTQADLVKSDLEDQQRLLARQLTQAARVSELLREHADLLGQIGRMEADLAAIKGEAASNDIALLQLQARRREEAVTRLRDLQFREIELSERQISLQDTLSRLDIRAATGGVVYGLQVFAVQSVVQPAQPLLYIIPQDQPLVVSARVESLNIDEVYVGQEASLRFPAFDQREIPEIKGHVTRISADVLTDEATGASYYSAEVVPDTEEMTKLGNHNLLPGMPVVVYIKTGDRTPLAYLVEPMTVFFDRAMRE
ncbi:HlyD family type I secretion periplasmic adaptor subunit [Actibacterium sp. XHP0104]|uniref:HlyD family type I secretion periplasmic adaptor subunit n=1 Tax=Actibacterium sp. XHP0104 TaxID=2984335 RepID=UPI0021E78F7A|nr:HlyD family type I secretion periplasmic adaptor subunit [Actibacterium sp. XHP0104]MCV2881852.1 HlyD family type I secretion periplasmic adaptor subunit [Actibacterium sp. XHP0104]